MPLKFPRGAALPWLPLGLLLLLDSAVLYGTCSPADSAQSPDPDVFRIQHSSSGKCLSAGSPSDLTLTPCDPSSRSQLWKWGSGHRLFHVSTASCLGLDVLSKMVSLMDCGGTVPLGWRCLEGALYTIYQMGLTGTDGTVGAKRDGSDAWVRGGSEDNICQRPYRVVHTMGGNSAGRPCDFPFKSNGSWHHGCLPDPDDPGLTWCSTSSDYDRDGHRGQCLTPEVGCGPLFSGPEGSFCYQFVSSAAVTWREALDSCHSQNSDLFSLTDPDDLISKTLMEGLTWMPERMWIGLHQLDLSQGWQWSDGSPFSSVRWEQGMPSPSSIMASDCSVLNSKQNFESESCDKQLPYICKKRVNASEPTHTEPYVYRETVCPPGGWTPWDGWCYMLMKDEPQNFSNAQQICNKTAGAQEGSLSSFHNMESKEMLHTNFHSDGQILDVWIGLIGLNMNPTTVFRWIDQQPVTFTYWGPNEPDLGGQDTSCVFYSGESHSWKVGNCSLRLPFMCQTKGAVNSTTEQTGCSFEDGWRRHGNSCFQVNDKQVSFKDQCNVTIRNGFEQAFINRLLSEHISQEPQFFWIGLQDIKNTREYQWLSQDGSSGPVTYTNWEWYEPSQSGGCAVMSTAQPLGRWLVKNCTVFKAGTICRTDLVPPPPPEPEPDPSAPCPDGWVSRDNIKYCYKVFHEERLSRKRSWEEAERFCEALGSHLPSFTNMAEMKVLHSIMRDSISNNRYFWVGLNRRNPADPSWTWSDGRPVTVDMLRKDFIEDDAYNRDCTAFKSLKHLFVLSSFYASPFHCDARLEWLCQIPRGKTPRTPEWYNPGGHHESSIFVDGAEFWFVKEPKLSFEEAKLYCSGNGSKLASPRGTTAAIQIYQFIKTNSSSPKQKWWVDLTEPSRIFPMSYHQMMYYHATFLGRCVSLSPESMFPDHDVSCVTRLSFVCERHNTTSVERNPLEPQPEGLHCGNTSLSFRNKCYTLMTSLKPVSFKYANEECESVRGTLVTIADQVEQDFISTLLPSIRNMERIWIGLKIRRSQPEWLDQSPVSFMNFNPLLVGMHKSILVNIADPDSIDFCVFLINNPHSAVMGTWDYSSCSQFQSSAICQHYADTVEQPQVITELFHVGNHSVQMLMKNLTWSEALDGCKSLNMDLVSVSDAAFQAQLTVHVSRARTPMWIGLFSEDGGSHFHWSDGSHTVFSRWTADDLPLGGSCAFQDTDGFWRSTECEEELGGAICHTPLEENVPKPEEVSVKCPHKKNGPNWIPFRGNCYSFQLQSTRWYRYHVVFQESCRLLDPGAAMLTVRNQEENEFIRQQLLPFQSLAQFVLLGMFQDDNDNQLKWYDGTNVQFSNWASGRPTVTGRFMAGLSSEGSWLFVSNPNLFLEFKQRTIVACKLDKEPKQQYNTSWLNFQRYGNLSYTVLAQKLNWYQALEQCARRGGHLASVHDLQHDAHMELIARTDGFPLWIGLSSQDLSGSDYEWSDGTKLDYKADGMDESKLAPPTPATPTASCVLVTPAGLWVKRSCSAVADGAVCYNSSFSSAAQTARQQRPLESNLCPQGSGEAAGLSRWVQHQDQCYAFDMSFYNYSVYSLEQAIGLCQDMDAELLTINTKEENDFVSQFLSEDHLITSRVWLGLDVDSEGKPVSWHDGSVLSFSNWRPAAPTGAKTGAPTGAKTPTPRCAVMMMSEGGAWTLVSCQDRYSRVVCKTKAKSSGSPVALGLFIIVLLALVFAVAFVVYKKRRHHFTSTVRYKRTMDESDSTSIIADE